MVLSGRHARGFCMHVFSSYILYGLAHYRLWELISHGYITPWQRKGAGGFKSDVVGGHLIFFKIWRTGRSGMSYNLLRFQLKRMKT